MKRLQKIVDERASNLKVDLNDIKTKCEETGASADNLTTCSKVATFGRCVFLKIRNLLTEQHQIDDAGANSALNTSANFTSNAEDDVESSKP